ncbi:hypothetical protein [Erwinia sp.]|uniref:hypothetical protein n=1 Tax=Erwinia citreus TaxID=558 RepID=UPI003C745886
MYRNQLPGVICQKGKNDAFLVKNLNESDLRRDAHFFYCESGQTGWPQREGYFDA